MKLTVDNLACRRGARRVLEGVTFDLAPGRAMVLRGPNGAGKSTLIRVLAGLAPAAAGGADLGGLSLTGGPGEWREAVAYIGHRDAVKPALTVAENLTRWARILSGDPGRVHGALDRLALRDLAEAPAGVLSAGNMRRLGLARLLVVDRPLWLLDEPTVSLDAAATGVVADMIADHCAGGGLALAATHIDLGLGDAPVLEVGRFAPAPSVATDVFAGDDW